MKANEAKHTFTTTKFLCFSLVFASCYKCSQQTRSYILLDFCHTKKKRQLVEADDRIFKFEDTGRWWKSLGGLKAYPNDPNAQVWYTWIVVMFFMFLDVERKRNLRAGMQTSGEDMSNVICMCMHFRVFYCRHSWWGYLSCISFLVLVGNWQKHGVLRGLLSISIDKI